MKILVWGSHQTEMGFREKVTEVKCLHHIRSTCYQHGLSKRRFPCGMGPGHWQVVALSLFLSTWFFHGPFPSRLEVRSVSPPEDPRAPPQGDEPRAHLSTVGFLCAGADPSCCDLGRDLSTPLACCLACCPWIAFRGFQHKCPAPTLASKLLKLRAFPLLQAFPFLCSLSPRLFNSNPTDLLIVLLSVVPWKMLPLSLGIPTLLLSRVPALPSSKATFYMNWPWSPTGTNCSQKTVFLRNGTNWTLLSYLWTCALEKILWVASNKDELWALFPSPQLMLELLTEQLKLLSRKWLTSGIC